MSALDDARARIDAIDREVLSLLAERDRIARELAAWKRDHALPLRDPAREEAMLRERRAWADALGLPPWVAEAVTRVVLAANRGMTDEDREALCGR